MQKLSIKSWSVDDRPREKLQMKGKSSLSDAELVAILIGSGNKNESAVALSKRILQTHGNNLNQLSKLSIEELTKFNGIGEAKAISIITALELGRRRQYEERVINPKITCSKDVAELMQAYIGDLSHEEFWVLYLNNSNKVLAKEQISKGGYTATHVDIRIVFKRALELNAVGIILCHNHPSGKLKASTSDINLTTKITKSGEILNIKILDHVIVTENNYFSFADEGIL